MNFSTKRTAFVFVVLIGVISFFADMTYEGARSIGGQYLAILGASGTIVSIVAGLGEFIGYGVRFISGYLADRTGKYWTALFIGYLCNLLAVPLLALAGSWQMAALLILLERFGKAIRNPSRDALLSYAAKETGRGWGFGLHEAMDKSGAIIGPLIASWILYRQGTYQESFAFFLIPALCALSVLVYARVLYPRPQDLEKETYTLEGRFSKRYWLYVAAISCTAAGYVDFALVAFHFKKNAIVSDIWIPLLFAISMGSAALASLICGRLYDRFGLPVLMFAAGGASLFTPLVFLDGFHAALAGMILWGMGVGVQGSVMQASIADLVPVNRRSTAFGISNMWYGISWFMGSALMGWLYDVSLISLVIFSCLSQLAAIPFFYAVLRARDS